MRLEVFVQTSAEGLGLMVVQVGLARVKGMGEGMEVVVLDMGNVGMTMETEMEIVCMWVRVLKVREGHLRAEDEETVGMPDGRGEERDGLDDRGGE